MRIDSIIAYFFKGYHMASLRIQNTQILTLQMPSKRLFPKKFRQPLLAWGILP